MDVSEMRQIVSECKFHDYMFHVEIDGRGAIYLQANYVEDDVDTLTPEVQRTRRWFLSPQMTKSEIVQTAFKCVLTSMEHRTREWFRYQGRAVFGPHFNIDVLWEACGHKEDHRQ